MKRPLSRSCRQMAAALLMSVTLSVAQTPANSPPPNAPQQKAPAPPQAYDPELVQQGKNLFAQDCAFCHGRDAAGGEIGPDLTRSKVVRDDVGGDQIGPVVRNGRAESGMPPFDLSDQQIESLVAFVHTQQKTAMT